MADPVGEFKMQMKNNSFTKAADGTVVAVADFEGTAGDAGVTFGTLHVPLPEGGAKSGTCTWMGQAFPDGSPWGVGSGEGTWEQVEGLNRWKLIFPVVDVSDGSRIRSEGELDLETRGFNGQLFDAS